MKRVRTKYFPIRCRQTRAVSSCPITKARPGPSTGRLQSTESRYVLLLNNDIELEPDYIERLVARPRFRPDAGFCDGQATARHAADSSGRSWRRDADGRCRLPAWASRPRQWAVRSCHARNVRMRCRSTVSSRKPSLAVAGWIWSSSPTSTISISDCAHSCSASAAYICQRQSLTTSAVQHWATRFILASSNISPAIKSYLLLKDYPRPVLFRLLPRILVYQWMWMLFALRNRALGAYFRGLIAAMRGSGSMRAKHRDLLVTRGIGDAEFLTRLRDSERQIYDWHQSRPPARSFGPAEFLFSDIWKAVKSACILRELARTCDPLKAGCEAHAKASRWTNRVAREQSTEIDNI